jgi:hypothetical protein
MILQIWLGKNKICGPGLKRALARARKGTRFRGFFLVNVLAAQVTPSFCGFFSRMHWWCRTRDAKRIGMRIDACAEGGFFNFIFLPS